MTNDKNSGWFALSITVETTASEAIEYALNELGALGTEINNLGKKMPEKLTVVGYFNDLPNEKLIENELSDALQIYGFSQSAILETSSQPVENTDWLAEWKKHWKPTETNKFIVAPIWETIENSEKIVIRIEPSMAFGTGTHETTRLCLQAIEEKFVSGESFFDVGTGTGILAIAAVKIQKANDELQNPKSQIPNLKSIIVGCDTDEDSIKIAEENAETNQVSDRINFYVGSISAETPAYDFVCANLTLDVIEPILPLLIEKSNRILVLSGILKEQEDLIVARLEKAEIKNAQISTFGEWISVIIENEKSKTEN